MAAIPTHVEGLDKALAGGVPEGNMVLVAGGPGTMKSTLVYSILHHNASNGVPGLFVSLEQEAPDVVEKMAKLGMPPLPEDRLYVMDMTHLRLAFRDKEKGKDWIKILSNLFEEAVHAGGYKLFALDSLEVLYAIVAFKEVRRELFHFVGMLKELGFTPFLVAETPLGVPVREGRPEDFLADGIILMEQFPVGAMGIQLRTRCVKMRGSHHDRGYFLMDWDGGRFLATKAIQQ
jgi:KaiC/GvpD/RAD55 family RecA-like ATPase